MPVYELEVAPFDEDDVAVASPVALDVFAALEVTADEPPPAEDPVLEDVVVALEPEQAAIARSTGNA